MKAFIPKEKLSKKARRALNAQSRKMWAISPVSRRSGTNKAYDRKAPRTREEYPEGGALVS